jgi:nucleotide-binding universal stress UspA family protein
MITAVSSSRKKEQENPRLGPVGLRFRSILVATDCSPASATAVKLAARFAKESHARLCVLHSIMPEIYAVNMGSFPELDQVNLQNARENLREYDEHIPELRAVKHEEITLLDSPGAAIQCVSEANHIDLLVLGSRGRRGLAKLALGSVAEWAIRHLNYPVLVAGPQCDKTWRPIRSIVLAADLSEGGLRSAQYASSMAQDYNARLTLVHVLPHGSKTESQAVTERDIIGKLHQLLPSDAEEDCTPQFEVKSGEAAAEVLHSAHENRANIVVLSARHSSLLADRAPRTKLSTIIGGARCPVLVVPSRS